MSDLQAKFDEYINTYGRTPNASQFKMFATIKYSESSKFIKISKSTNTAPKPKPKSKTKTRQSKKVSKPFTIKETTNTYLEDNKYESESDDDQFQEAIVTGGDGGRRRVYECDPQPDDIYQFIGQIYATFDYMNEYTYRITKKGTGTMVFIDNTDQKDIKRAYILTCAHNVRHNVMFCSQCNVYRAIRDKKRNKTFCIKCGEKTLNQKRKVIKATKITFMPRSISKNDFGVALIKKDYICKEEFVPDRNYMNYCMPKDGFDWAFISCLDIYNIYKKQPNIEFVYGKEEFTNNIKRSYQIFGYPGDKNDEMWGMISDENNFKQFQVKTNAITKMKYLEQVAIDTMAGESGALIWFKEENISHICGIHCGGSKGGTKKSPNPYNIATLIGRKVTQKFGQIKNNKNRKNKKKRKPKTIKAGSIFVMPKNANNISSGNPWGVKLKKKKHTVDILETKEYIEPEKPRKLCDHYNRGDFVKVLTQKGEWLDATVIDVDVYYNFIQIHYDDLKHDKDEKIYCDQDQKRVQKRDNTGYVILVDIYEIRNDPIYDDKGLIIDINEQHTRLCKAIFKKVKSTYQYTINDLYGELNGKYLWQYSFVGGIEFHLHDKLGSNSLFGISGGYSNNSKNIISYINSNNRDRIILNAYSRKPENNY